MINLSAATLKSTWRPAIVSDIRYSSSNPDKTSWDSVVEPSSAADAPLPTLSTPESVVQPVVEISPSNYPSSLLGNIEHSSIDDILGHVIADELVPSEGYYTIDVTNFSVYRQEQGASSIQDRFANEFALLNAVNQRGGSELYLDGVIHHGADVRRFVKVPFDKVSIEGYGAIDSPKVTIWAQTSLEHLKRRFWFRLVSCSNEYDRYWRPYLWLAQFAKHFVDYCADPDINKVNLCNLKADFHAWLLSRYDPLLIEPWINELSNDRVCDFRQAFVAYSPYLWNETWNVSRKCCHQKIWKEAHSDVLNSIARQPQCAPATVVTELVYAHFKGTYFASVLESFRYSSLVNQKRTKRIRSMGFATAHGLMLPNHDLTISMVPCSAHRVKVGDIVCIPPDAITPWKTKAEMWLAYVQEVKSDGSSARLGVLWLYRPSDTTLDGAHYAYSNELFLSDHCNCRDPPFFVQDVTHKLKVRWCPPGIPQSAFIRQRYMDESFTSLDMADASHFRCKHKQPPSPQDYRRGDTILITPTKGQKDILEPCVVEEASETIIRVRPLLRANRVTDNPRAANEVVWTDTIVTVSVDAIVRRCHVRFYPHASQIPHPYDRNGCGDCFYFSRSLKLSDNILIEMSEPPIGFKQGFDPRKNSSTNLPPLTGLSLFSGGGNFDFGLEEAGAVRTKHFIEWDGIAAHTIQANSREKAQVFLGSVDDFLKDAIEGVRPDLAAQVGDIHFISAGSPCQGFSIMQRSVYSERSKINASKVATVASFIDLYRPGFAILENVPNMARKVDGEYSVFSQLKATLVGMGYQVRACAISANEHGDPQLRRRLFIIAAAPGLVLPEHPAASHIRYKTNSTSLGRTPNGEVFGSSLEGTQAPFPIATAAQALKHLPNVGDGHVGMCIPFPDHRVCAKESRVRRLVVRTVERWPRKNGIVRQLQRNGCTSAARTPNSVSAWMKRQTALRLSKSSNMYTRVDPNSPLPAITTSPNPSDALAGNILHWDQHRVLTVLEARKAQGYLDDQIVLGNPRQQWKIIGNSVSRGVATALGISLRMAWDSSPKDRVRCVLSSTSVTRDESLDASILDTPQTKSASKMVCIANDRQQPQVIIYIPSTPNATDEESPIVIPDSYSNTDLEYSSRASQASSKRSLSIVESTEVAMLSQTKRPSMVSSTTTKRSVVIIPDTVGKSEVSSSSSFSSSTSSTSRKIVNII